jgi:hypothetical protein
MARTLPAGGRTSRDAAAYDGAMPRRQLPSDFAWYTPTWDLQARSLRIGHQWGMEIAYVSMRADGRTWLSSVNRHRGPGLRRHAVSSSQAIAMKWAGLWAAAHAHRLREMAVEWEKPKGKWVAFRRGGEPPAAPEFPESI